MQSMLPQLHMRRQLVALPPLTIAPGYALRPLTPSDGQAWATILAENGELGAWDLARAAPYFAPDGPMVLAASFFATKDGEPVATASLHLHLDDEYAPTPELGWVAVLPPHRGRRLGAAVCLAVLHAAAARGFSTIFLRTDDFRLPAIRTYLQLGFQPWLYDPSAPARWRAILTTLRLDQSAGA